MDEGTVGWDPISVNHQLPWEEKVFILYLGLVTVFSLTRSLQLASKLWFSSSPKRVSSDQPKLDASDLLAANALTNKLPNNDETAWTSWQVVEGARPVFEYLWEQSAARVAAMKNLANLTLILSGLTSAYILMKNLLALVVAKIWLWSAVAGGIAEVLQMVVLGLAVSAALYVLSSLYAGALAWRKAAWNLFVARVSDQHKVE